MCICSVNWYENVINLFQVLKMKGNDMIKITHYSNLVKLIHRMEDEMFAENPLIFEISLYSTLQDLYTFHR